MRSTQGRPSATTAARLADQLDRLPSGSVVTIHAGPGYGKSTLAAAWVQASSVRAALITLEPEDTVPAHLATTFVDALAGMLGVENTREAVRASLGNRPCLIVIDRAEILVGSEAQAARKYLRSIVAALPPSATLALVGRAMPEALPLPRSDGRRVALDQTRLALPADALTGPGWAHWPASARTLLLEETHGWPLAARVIEDYLHRYPDDAFDAALARVELLDAASPYVPSEADLADANPRTRTLVMLAATAPATTDDLVAAHGPEVAGRLGGLAAVPAPLVSHRDGTWFVAPLLRAALARSDAGRDAMSDAAIRHVEHLAGTRRFPDAFERLATVNDGALRAHLVAWWASMEALRGFPEKADALLQPFSALEVTSSPHLLVAHCLVAFVEGDLGPFPEWIRILERHHDPDAPAWSARHPATSEILAVAAGLRPGGASNIARLDMSPPWLGLTYALTSFLHAAEGDFVGAEGFAKVSRPLLGDLAFVETCRVATLGYALFRAGKVGEALELYRRLEPSLGTTAEPTHAAFLLSDAVLGRLAAADGDLDKAAALTARAMARLPRMTVGYHGVRLCAAVLACETSRALGHHAAARTALRFAEQAAPGAEGATDLLARLAALQSPGTITIRSAPLTETQRRVLEHLSGPYPVDRIAEAMFVSTATVRSHIRSIYQALGVSSRAAAVDRGRELGLLD